MSSLLNPPSTIGNFIPYQSAKLDVSAISNSVTFDPLTDRKRQTFKITNKGENGAYVAYGYQTATAVVSTSTPGPNCDYVAPGSILTQDFEASSGVVDTVAAVQDGGSTTLEITIGSGQ